MNNNIEHVIREETLFAGIRKPIKSREELHPRIQEVKDVCGDKIDGPLTHILRFDTPVDGFDSEIGYPVVSAVNSSHVRTHTLRRMHFFSLMHRGAAEDIRDTTLKIFEHMKQTGLSPELELMEIYHHYDPGCPDEQIVEARASFLAWPEVYKEQLLRVLGPEKTTDIWQGGEHITPFTLVDERVEWVAKSLERLKGHSNQEQQFDILSRVALVRPVEDIMKYKKIYEAAGDVNKIMEAQNEELKAINENLEVLVQERVREIEIHNQALELSHAILDELPVPIVGVGADGMIVLVNKQTQALSGQREGADIGRQLVDCFPHTIQKNVQGVLATNTARRLDNCQVWNETYNVELRPLTGRFQGTGVILTFM